MYCRVHNATLYSNDIAVTWKFGIDLMSYCVASVLCEEILRLLAIVFSTMRFHICMFRQDNRFPYAPKS